MALIRICDVCENDDGSVIQIKVEDIPSGGSNFLILKDLCGDCRVKLSGFLEGNLVIEEDEEPEESKKEQDEDDYQGRAGGD